MAGNARATGATDRPVIERVFEAPRELVWRAWTDPDHFVRWWAPEGFSVSRDTIEVRVGRRLHYRITTPELGEIWAGSVFYEIDPPSRLVFADYLADEHGNRVPPAHYNLGPDVPEETVTSVTFEDIGGGRTKMILR